MGSGAASQPLLPQRVLGKTGVKVSCVGLGGVGFLTDMNDRDAVAALLVQAIESGISYFDTAPTYGDGKSEESLGLVMGTARRKGVFLAGKVEDRTYDGALRQVEKSLKRLRTDSLDLIQVHYVNKADDVKAFGNQNGVLPALRKLREQKVVRFIGMTGHPDFAQVKEALEAYDWDTFMCWVNPSDFCKPVFEQQLPVARKKEMGIIAMKVFGGDTPGKLVGEGKGKAPASLLLRFALGQPISTAIPAISSQEHLKENTRFAREFMALSEEERKALIERINPGPRT